MRLRLISGAILAGAMVGAAHADVLSSAPDGMIIQVRGEVPLERDAAWSRLIQPGLWWPDDHTYSGSAASMYIDAVAGGCFCELWDTGEAVHGRVMLTIPGEMLRLSAPLGPLQGMGVSAAITFTLSNGSATSSNGAIALTAGARSQTTTIVADFQVSGSSLSGLDKLAPIVDQVFTSQVAGYLALGPELGFDASPELEIEPRAE